MTVEDTAPMDEDDRPGTAHYEGEGDRAMLQGRLGYVAVLIALAGFIALCVVRALGLIPHNFPSPQDFSQMGLIAIGGGALALLSRPRTRASLGRLDVGLMTAAGLSLFVMGWVGIGAPLGRVASLTLATNTLMARAVFVPSPPRRTALVGVIVLLPLVTPRWLPELPGLEYGAVYPVPMETALLTGWTVITVTLTFVVSSVIYDLREVAMKRRRFGAYHLLHKIGAGEMGEVYRASHAMLQRPTAIKLLRPDRAGEAAIVRFEQEVRHTASLTHPNTVAVYDFGRTADRVFYYAMELLDGFDLQDLVERTGPVPPGRALHILKQIAGSLAEAHSMSIVHRDIKAANVMLCRRGRRTDVVKVVDFGLARDVRVPERTDAGATVTGTPAYLAPEAWQGAGSADSRTDVYAIGILGWFLMAGRLPFDAPSPYAMAGMHLSKAPPELPLELMVPETFARVVRRCLAKAPGDRYADGEALLDALEEITNVEAWTTADARGWWDRHGGSATTNSIEAMPEELESRLERLT